MSAPVTAGGASLAPAPAHSRQLSQEPSKEDLESAAVLGLLTQSHERFANPRGSDPQVANVASNEHRSLVNGASGNPAEVPEYHSLDDTLNYQSGGRSIQILQSPSPAPVNLPQRCMVNNAPIVGQICRYVPGILDQAAGTVLEPC